MPVTNEQIQHSFEVTDLAGAAVGGLVNANFTKTLERLSGSSWVAASEPVTVTAMSGTAGAYYATFTPTLAATYRLLVIHATYGTNPYRWEDVVTTDYGSSGPYLTTLASVKMANEAWNTSAHDARINALIASVSAAIESYCGRVFSSASVTEYRDALGTPVIHAFLNRPPVTAVSAVYFSTSLPRVYDSTTLLVDGTDYFVDEDSGVLTLMSSRGVSIPAPRIFRVDYTGGYATIPEDLQRAADEIVGVKIQKGFHGQYHLTTVNVGDGGVGGIRFDDWPQEAREVIDRYVLRAVA